MWPKAGKGCWPVATRFSGRRKYVTAHFHPRHRVAPCLDNKDRVLSAVSTCLLIVGRGNYDGDDKGREGEGGGGISGLAYRYMYGYNRANLIRGMCRIDDKEPMKKKYT